MSAHPDDILVVCWSEERRLYRQFDNRQVLNINSPSQFQGRRFRTAWVTTPAFGAVRARGWEALEQEAWFRDAEIKHVNEYEESA